MRRGICGCKQPVTDVGFKKEPRWIHDGDVRTPHKPFAITKVART